MWNSRASFVRPLRGSWTSGGAGPQPFHLGERRAAHVVAQSHANLRQWIGPPAARDIESVARENVVEGCVRETFGALLAEVQAETAGDPAVARVMRGIAEDEACHAALAWRIDAWMQSQLHPESRERVEQARDAAVEELRAGLDATLPEPVRRAAGLPDPPTARWLLCALDRSLWDRARAGFAAHPCGA
jgi:hypothetical protein